MKLKDKRLQAIATLLKGYKSFADIGADHGKLSVFALVNNMADKVIATDISALSLQKTCDLAKKHRVNVELRVGDGLQPIEDFEVECIVIAGLGGHEIVKILFDRLKDFGNYILLPHKNPHLVRKFLKENDVGISFDKVIRENNFFYHVIACSTNSKWKSTDIFVGSNNSLEQQDFVKYLSYRIGVLDKIINKNKNNEIYIEEKKELYKWIV